MEQNYYYTTEPQNQPPKKKKGRVGAVIAGVLAVAVIGGGAGFGGAYAASSLLKPQIGVTAPESGSKPDTVKPEEKPNNSANGDVSSALDAILSSGNAGASNTNVSVTPTGANGAYTPEELYAAVNDSIVLINIYKASSSGAYDYYDYYFGYGDRNKDKNTDPVLSGYGSGIIFTDDGYVLTNAHIADNAAKLEVVVNDYEDSSITHTYEATILGSDTSTDIAVLKIERSEKFKSVKLGDSDSLRVGQQVCAIGNPGITSKVMFDHTMTSGIISGLNRMCLSDDGYSISLIQTDAAINSGNSGGGLFDMYGNVVGVVNSKIIATTYEGLGFALTINEAKPIMEDLLNYGYVKSRPVIGITTVELNEYRAELYGTKLSKGLLVASINENEPVAKSDLRVSDIITKINGETVETLIDVQSIINKFRVGDTVTLTVARMNDSGGLDSVDVDVELTSLSE